MGENIDKNRLFSRSDFPKLCRSCLCEVHEGYFFIGGFYQRRKVLDIYQNVTSVQVQVKSKDKLPNKLCAACYNQIIKFDLFKNRVLESEKRLIKCLNEIVVKSEVGNLYTKSEFVDLKSNGEDDFYKDSDQGDKVFHDEGNSKDPSENVFFLLDKGKKNNGGAEQNHTSKIEDKNDNGGAIYLNVIKATGSDKNCGEVIPQNSKELPKVKWKKEIRKKVKSEGDLDKNKKFGKQRELCTECGIYIMAHNMENHMRYHPKEKPYGCEQCEARFSEESNLNRHLKTHGDERPYKCKTCGKGFLRPSSKVTHEKTAHHDESFICYCGEGFPSQDLVEQHKLNGHKSGEKMKVVMMKKQGYPCSICGKLYKTRSTLRVHQINHERPKAFLCTICGNKYSSKASLESHQSLHTGEKNFSCNVCHKKFRFKTALRTHAMVHTGEKPLSCEICHRQFRQYAHLRAHITAQHSAERFQCSFCDKSFNASCNLTVHMRIHTGETRYHCDVCQKGFYNSCRMERHRKSHSVKNNLSVASDKMDEDDKMDRDDQMDEDLQQMDDTILQE